ncbi:DUF4271 domain-containing protein [Siphonobacter sp. SORGH_AS_0500]|uniref:DUF4271 domain-containing protein n=1 Tax=Siphonobacter sp. SORGH_AS_0500 TaxID=1864824 RepID=UPI0012FF2689|nr:DUF4271 domain-containing protein [Siphonobacter sp. SORGH_AS_0500]
MGSFLTHRLHCFWIFILFALAGTSAFAQTTGPEDGYFLVHDFRNDWRVYDEQAKTYVPYIREMHQQYGSYSVILDIAQNRHYYLLYRSDQENYLFINGSLQKKLPEKTWTIFKLDSLYKVSPDRRVLLTLYGPQPGIDQKTLQIGHKIGVGQKPIYVSESFLQARPRDDSPFEDFYVLGALLLLLAYASIYRRFPRDFIRYLSIKDLLTIHPREGAPLVTRGLLEIANLLFLLLISFVLSFLYQLIRYRGIDLFKTQALFQQEETMGQLFFYFIFIGILIFIVFLLKYVMVNVLGHIYKFDKIVNIHFFKSMQSSAIFYTGISVLMLFMLNTFPSLTFHWDNLLLIPITGFYIGRLVLLYFSINKLSDAKNLYLFSYLCIVELVPFIIGLKFAL